MKFLFGIVFGVFCSVAVMLFPQVRQSVFSELEARFEQTTQPDIRTQTLLEIKESFLDQSIYEDLLVADAEKKVAQEQAVPKVWLDEALSEPIPEAPLDTPLDIADTPHPESRPAIIAAPLNYTIWSPFRSEISASGFANNLSTQLDRAFRVVRRAPGHYEVVFDYLSDTELVEVLDAVEKITGVGQPDSRVSAL